MKLYELASEILKLSDQLDSGVDEQTKEELFKQLDDINWESEKKVESVVKWIRNLEAEAEGIETEVERLAARAKARRNKVESLREFLAWFLNISQIRKMNVGIATVSLGTPKTRIEVDTEECHKWPPDIYDAVVRESITVDKNALKRDFAARLAELPGVSEVAGKLGVTIR